jgi:hypothetical protein
MEVYAPYRFVDEKLFRQASELVIIQSAQLMYYSAKTSMPV